MITYFIYALIFIILVYVLYLAVKAIGRGIDAKQNLDRMKKLYEKKSISKAKLDEALTTFSHL